MSYTRTLAELARHGADALPARVQASDGDRRKKLSLSFTEFAALAELIELSPQQWPRSTIRRVSKAIDGLKEVDPTTARNRQTLLATLALRAGSADSAIELLQTARADLESELERGLSWLVEGQAVLAKATGPPADAFALFVAAEQALASLPEQRFVRVARAYRVQTDASASNWDRLGIWTPSMLGGNRFFGPWVVKYPNTTP